MIKLYPEKIRFGHGIGRIENKMYTIGTATECSIFLTLLQLKNNSQVLI